MDSNYLKNELDYLKDLREHRTITEDDYIKEIMELAKEFVEKELDFQILGENSHGKYSNIIAKPRLLSERFAVKIQMGEITSPEEVTGWKKLQHPYIQELLQYHYIEELDIHLFFTDPRPKCLCCVLREDDDILGDRDSLHIVGSWLRQILEALDYLHKKGYCHLSLSLESILIASDGKAILSKFHCMHPAHIPANKYEVPGEYTPPEACPSLRESSEKAMNGKAFDIWNFGILALKIFSEDFMDADIPQKIDSWSQQIYPILFENLQIKKFKRNLKYNFPSCKKKDDVTKAIHNIILACLNILPEDRPSAASLKHHKFFDPSDGFLSIYQDSWIKKTAGPTKHILFNENFKKKEKLWPLRIRETPIKDAEPLKKKNTCKGFLKRFFLCGRSSAFQTDE